MRCPRCRRTVRDERGKCVRCGCDLRRGASSSRQLDRRTDRGPIGPLDDFILRETLPTKRVSRNPAGEIATRPTGRPLPSSRTHRAQAVTAGPSRVASATPSLAFGASSIAAPPTTDGDARDPAGPFRGLGRRLAAFVIDTTLLLGIDVAVIYFTLRLASLSVAEAAQLPLVPLSMFLLFFDLAYVITLTACGGQTIGKMALGLRVERCGGEPVRLTGALARTAAYTISVLPAGLGLAGIFLYRRCALHDLIAHTRVVKVS